MEVYSIEDDGTFAVTFAGSGAVGHLDGVPQLGLNIDRADDVAFHLEAIDRLAATRAQARLDSRRRSSAAAAEEAADRA